MADNSSRKFKFISPGVYVNEIDNSQLPAQPGDVGPLIIGRSRKGPADKPVEVSSFSDFVQTFGEPSAGNEGSDIWREGDSTAPTYAAYAAQAWLKNNSPVTFMRVLGDEHPQATASQSRRDRSHERPRRSICSLRMATGHSAERLQRRCRCSILRNRLRKNPVIRNSC